jgi:putative ABC transport system ATP-binding protein
VGILEPTAWLRCELDCSIELLAVTKRYASPNGLVEALPPTSLSARVGESVAIVGPSGVGKSTLLAIAGLLLRPDSGTIKIDGAQAPDGEEHRAAFRGEKLGFVFQAFNLLEHKTAVDNVIAGLTHASRPGASKQRGGRDDESLAMDALRRVGVEGRARHNAGLLSGGEQQRVAIARAIVKGPGVILADEPTGNLDDYNSGAICDLLLGLSGSATVLVVTHDQGIAARCDRVASIDQQGRTDG